MPEVRHSVCALDCPDACGLVIQVENGIGSRLRGNPDHPVTRGFLCGKVARYLDREYSPDRVLYPQKRVGAKGEGRFERITWTEAIDTISARLKAVAAQYGPEAVLPYSYGGSMGYLQGSGMDHRFFHRLGASRLDRTICSAAGMVGAQNANGFRYGTEPEQFTHSKLIIAWGANIHGTNIHLWPFIVEARRRGAKLIVIDPVTTRTARLADLHLTPYPGSDLALALGMAHVILREGLEDRDFIASYTTGIDELRERAQAFTPARVQELTGIPAAGVETLAIEYATVRPAVIRCNYGVQRSERGAAAVHAIAALPSLTGSWREVGGGYQLSTSHAFQVNRASLEMPELQKKSALGREARLVNMSELGSALTRLDNPPVQAMVVYNSNPAAVAPDQSRVREGLARKDLFTVVLEQMQTDTADFADILLPSTTFLEHTDLFFAYGHYYIQLARPALPAPGETKSNVEVFRLLAGAMGFSDPCFAESEDDMIRGLLDSGHRHLDGITLERLDREHFVRLNVSPEGTPFLPFAEGKFGTASGKSALWADYMNYQPPVESRLGDVQYRERFPLEMISSKNDDSMNSTFGNRSDTDSQTGILRMHGEDAGPRGIHSGDRVRVFNRRGAVLAVAQVDGEVRRGVVRLPSMRWSKRSDGGAGVNVLVSERLTDAGGGPTFYNCMVEVERCGD